MITWERRGLVLVGRVIVDNFPAPDAPRLTRADVARMIACPTCLVRVDQQCRTTTGRHRAPHSTRLIPRRCGCGGMLAEAKKVCQACKAEARRVRGRQSMRRTRARRQLSTGPVDRALDLAGLQAQDRPRPHPIGDAA